MQRQKTKRTTGALVALALFASISLIASMSAVRPASALSVLSVGRTSSGLVTSDSLTTGNTNLWVFGGSAVAQGTPYSYHEDSSGLYLGVQSNQPGQWSGYYASRGEQAQVFHADLTLPAAILADNQSFNTGLYVQTGGVDVNYVTCGAGVDGGGYYWAVVEATGTPYGATNYNTLYFNWENSQPLTRSCTIVTNGANLLQVYLDGTQVYSSTSMSLGYQSPFSVFLEVQGTDNTVMRFSNYTDYYATTSPTVTVNGAVPGSTAELVSPSGTVLASGSVGQSGTATMDIASFDMPLTANVVVTDGGVTLASTSAPVQVYGGDVYSVGALGTGTTSAQPYTANPWTTNILNVNLGGLTVDLGSGSGSGSGGGLCILGICL